MNYLFISSHDVTTTFPLSADISAAIESAVVVLLRFILSPNVVPPFVEALNITSPFAFDVPLSVDHTT